MKNTLYISPKIMHRLNEKGEIINTIYILEACSEQEKLSVQIDKNFVKDINCFSTPMYWAIETFCRKDNTEFVVGILEQTEGVYLFNVYYKPEIVRNAYLNINKHKHCRKDVLC